MSNVEIKLANGSWIGLDCFISYGSQCESLGVTKQILYETDGQNIGVICSTKLRLVQADAPALGRYVDAFC